MWIKKVLHKKTQFVIILLLTMVASAIAVGCISFMLESNRFVREYYAAENNPICYLVLSREDGKELIGQNEECKKLVKRIETGSAKYSRETMYHKKKAMSNGENVFYGVSDIEKIGYQVSIAKGVDKKAPAEDEIWISSIYADAFDIKVGDELKVGKVPLQVGAIVNTAMNSSGFMNDYPFYVNKNVLEKVKGTKGYAYYVYAKNDEITNKQITDALPQEVYASLLEAQYCSALKLCLSILSGIFGGVGIAAAVIIILVSLIVFRYLIRAAITKEYPVIGTYKALGMDTPQIMKIYCKAYMVFGILGMLPGVFLGRPIARKLTKTVLGNMPKFRLGWMTNVVSLFVLVFFCILLYFNIRGELRKIHKISPIQAMNLNTLSSEEKVGGSLIKSAHSSAAMAVNGIWKRRGSALLTILILLTSVYMDLVAGSIALTLSHYDKDRNVWENLPDYDCIVSLENEEVREFIESSDLVEDSVAVNLSLPCIGMTVEGTEKSYEETNPMVYENFTEKRYKNVPFIDGRICLNPHEITASADFLSEVGKKAGEYIEIGNGDKKIKFLIAGKYSAKIKGGVSFYLLGEDAEELGYETMYDRMLVFLKDGVTYGEFTEKLQEKVPDARIYEDFDFITQEGKTVSDIAYPICIVLAIAFALFSILNIINLIHNQNRENRRKYGILKAMGFTSGYIQRENVISFTIQYIFAVCMTVILQELLSPVLFSLACGVRFVCKPAWLTVAVCGGMYVILLLILMAMSWSVRKIRPVELMEE